MYLLDRVSMGVRIRERREELNITKCRLADMLGNTPKFIGDVESGSRGVSVYSDS